MVALKEKITKCTCAYPEGYEPDYIVPFEYCPYRFALGKKGINPLVVVCMNPSAARETSSDRTINRIVKVSQVLGKDGWIVFNIYPERATDAKRMNDFDQTLSDENMKVMKEYLIENGVNEVWGAWGDDKGIAALRKGKQQLKSVLSAIGVKVYYFGSLTKMGNPRHPLQRCERWDFSKRAYLDL